MLVLSRKVGEKIYVGDDVTIEVVLIERGKVRLGFVAPKEVQITRSELLEHQQDDTQLEPKE